MVHIWLPKFKSLGTVKNVHLGLNSPEDMEDEIRSINNLSKRTFHELVCWRHCMLIHQYHARNARTHQGS